VAVGSALSAAFIMAANSWMQRPVGYQINPNTGRAQLNDIWAVLTNTVFVWAYVHVLLAALVTAGAVMLGVSAWHLRRRNSPEVFGRSARLALVVLIPATLFTLMIGSRLGVVETTYQPMKIAAAEATWNTCSPCSFSLFQIGGGNNDQTPTKIIRVPHLLSLLATDSWNGQVQGLNELEAQYEQQYGPGYYIPNVFIQYWSMRVMAYGGALVFLIALLGGFLLWRGTLGRTRWFLWLAVWSAPLPFLLNIAGWLLTENGRQPWIVQGLQLTRNGVSTSVGTATIVTSIVVFLVLYGVLAIVDTILMTHYSRQQLAPETPGEEPAPELEFIY
jgi:cytochrome d ubiquinol oxidase subunit I